MKIPPCKHPDHPSDYPRDKGMIVVQESPKEVVFACEICRDVLKVMSAQVITLGHNWNAERELKGIKRAEIVNRTPVGRVTYFR